ncbi:pyruvate kinase [Cladochytrium replicatum]|nr:pyruvate kinase [Cladochytrium replicatum]
MLLKLRKAGMNIMRLNFSHGTHEYHGSCIDNLRKSFELEGGRPVAVALDTKGPEIRMGMVKDGEFSFKQGHQMIFTTNASRKDDGDDKTMYIDYVNITKAMKPGKFIYIDDGTLIWKVIEVGSDFVKVEAQNNGKLSSKKGVNLPNTDVDLPAVSEKDKQDLGFAVKYNVDMIFASFIRNADNVLTIRSLLGEEGKHIKIISKIENHQGLANFDEILKVTDGIMVARGDLGTEIPPWKVFIAQKSIIARCNIFGKPCICATQMLQSMTASPRPTRAESTDVANAIFDGADCVMLSAETASGAYPLEAVDIMHRICLEAESTFCHNPYLNDLRSITPRPLSTEETVALSAVTASLEEQADAIIVLTISGNVARLISKYRPRGPIIAVTRNAATSRQLHLYRGCYPFFYDKTDSVGEWTDEKPKFEQIEQWQIDVDRRLAWAILQAKSAGLIKPGHVVIAVQGWRGGSGRTNAMRILHCT